MGILVVVRNRLLCSLNIRNNIAFRLERMILRKDLTLRWLYKPMVELRKNCLILRRLFHVDFE